MALQWLRENSPRWDAHKQHIFGVEGPESLGLGSPGKGDTLADEWWRVEDDGAAVGYGRLDNAWGDAEILVGVAPERRRGGIGRFVLDHLEDVARQHGLNYLYNTVRPDHPDASTVVSWLRSQGFTEHGDGEFRKRVAAPVTN